MTPIDGPSLPYDTELMDRIVGNNSEDNFDDCNENQCAECGENYNKRSTSNRKDCFQFEHK